VVIRQSSPSPARRSTKPVMHEVRPSILSDIEPVVSKTRQMSTGGRLAKLSRVPGWRLIVEPSASFRVGVRPDRRAAPPPDTLGVPGVRSTSTSRLYDHIQRRDRRPTGAHGTPLEPLCRQPQLAGVLAHHPSLTVRPGALDRWLDFPRVIDGATARKERLSESRPSAERVAPVSLLSGAAASVPCCQDVVLVPSEWL
jgi:hypothetical protein